MAASERARSVLESRMIAPLTTFGPQEGNAILQEVENRMGEDGGYVSEWLSTIREVVLERHPYLRDQEPKLN